MRRAFLVAVLAAALAVPPAPAQSRAATGAFVTRLGIDTITVERYNRTAARLEGEVLGRSPRTSLRRYVADFSSTGSLARIQVTWHRVGAAADSPPLRALTAVVGADSVRVELRRGDTLQTSAVASAPGLLPTLAGAWAPLELFTVRSSRVRRDSIAVPAYGLSGEGARATTVVTLRPLGRDSLLVSSGTARYRVRTDREGRIVGLQAPGTTQQVTVERVPRLDIAAVATAWAALDAQGQAMGILSPRDTVRATVAGASLLVDYGRPRRRGREIFGAVVPWGQVWRAGANAATQLRTDRELIVGGLAVAAGTYTLWTVPTPSGWQLVINRQTGQWGTVYDAAQDLGRAPMSVESLVEPVEVFTIAVEPQGQGGVLSFAWDRTRASVPFTVR